MPPDPSNKHVCQIEWNFVSNRHAEVKIRGCEAVSLVSSCLHTELGLGTSATSMSRVGMTRELYNLVLLQLKSCFEALANLVERLLALFERPALASLSWKCFTDRPGPETDTVEATANIDDNAHDFIVVFVLQVLPDSSKHDMKPERVDVDRLLVFELEGPFATVLVLAVLPFGAHTFLEKMVVGL